MPTCQWPMRPGQSWTVVSTPGAMTSMRGESSAMSAMVAVVCSQAATRRSRAAAASCPRLVWTPSILVWPKASARAAQAASRSSPAVMILASIGS